MPETGLESMERYCPALLTIEESRKSDGLDLGRAYHRMHVPQEGLGSMASNL